LKFRAAIITMEKVDLTKPFAIRLREAMIRAGFNSQRSVSGVNIDKLAEITGYSLQICRKYLRGQAMPDPTKIMDIAEKLQVTPGWLLFGESIRDVSTAQPHITINRNLLHYIFAQAHELYNAHRSQEEIADFLHDLAVDISHIHANEEQSKKIIDLALSSARHFRTA